ncbi:conserved domain protein [Clostridium sp. CAG:1013]|nr:conserved domain protein [Clostridium sp. CAG:1013]
MGDGVQPVLHFLLDLPQPILLLSVLLPLFSGQLLLVGEFVEPLLHVLAVAHASHGPSGQSLAPQLLHVEDHIGGILQQGLVVRDVQHRHGAVPDELLQPGEGLNVQVVGRLIQQVAVGTAQSQKGHAQLHLLPAGKGGHLPFGIEPFQGEPKPLGGGGQFSRGGVQKGGFLTAELIGGKLPLVRGQLLGQVAQDHPVCLDGAGIFHVLFHHSRVVQQL